FRGCDHRWHIGRQRGRLNKEGRRTGRRKASSGTGLGQARGSNLNMAEVVFKKSTAREYFESLVITVILALFGTTFIVQAFKIPTPSMEDNLLVGDHLLVNKFVFGARGSIIDKILPLKYIKRGNVIVFKYPKVLTKHYVKRAIGLPGDHIK